MIFHENCLLADNSHEISYLIFFENLERLLQNLPSAAVVIGALRVNIFAIQSHYICIAKHLHLLFKQYNMLYEVTVIIFPLRSHYIYYNYRSLVTAEYHLHQRRFRRIYLSTNPSPHDPQNLLLAQTNQPMKTPGRIFSIFPSCQSH